MKKITFILTIALAFAGCGKLLDDIAPKHAVTTDTIGESDIVKLTNGLLYTMEGYFSNKWYDGDAMGEAFENGPGGAALVDVLLMTPSTPDVLSRWQKAMTTLRQVNELLGAATCESAAAENARKTAYFCRAVIYYNMAVRWGKAPILRTTTSEEIPLSSEKDVWGFVVENLNMALENKASSSGFFYVTDDAVNALLAKTYLWMGQKDNAATYAQKVISSSSYALAETSEDLATTWCFGTSSKEIIFALANKRTESLITPYTSVNDTDGSWKYSIPDALYPTLFADTAVKTGDIRKKVVTTDADPDRIIKYPNGNPEQNQFVNNESPTTSPLVIIRVAEMHLLKAEALGNTDAGHTALKTFMQKRYTTVNLPASMTDKEWEDLLLDEYLREFYAEGHRWFDVKRFGRLDKFQTLAGRNYLMYWPIPQHEIDLLKDKSAYPQNDGYANTNN